MMFGFHFWKLIGDDVWILAVGFVEFGMANVEVEYVNRGVPASEAVGWLDKPANFEDDDVGSVWLALGWAL